MDSLYLCRASFYFFGETKLIGQILQYYLKTGTCKYGSTCKYHHPLERRSVEQVPLNSLGLPMRQVLGPSSVAGSVLFTHPSTVF